MLVLLKGILTFIAATIVSLLVIPIGVIWAFIHAMYMSISDKWYSFFLLLYRFLVGTMHAVGYLFFYLGKFQDILWNVWAGELFEDFVTTNEDTWYGEPNNITISESTGREQIRNPDKIISSGNYFIKGLNVIFGQNQHAKDAYELGVKRKELESKYYK